MTKQDIKKIIQALCSVLLASLSVLAYIYTTRFSISYPKSYSNTIGFMPGDLIVLVLFAVLYYTFLDKGYKFRWGMSLLSLYLSINSVLLMDIYKNKSQIFTLQNTPILYAVLVFGLAILYYTCISYIDYKLLAIINNNTLSTSQPRPIKLALLLMALSLPVYIAMFPGSIRFEAGYTIGMISGAYTVDAIAPPFWQLFVSVFYYIGKAVSNDTVGLMLYFAVVGFASCYALALIIVRMLRLNINKWVLGFCIIFVAFNPFIILKMYTMKYDTLIALAMLYFGIMIYDIVQNGTNIINRKWLIMLSISVFCVCAFRSVGNIIAIITTVVLGIYCFRRMARKAVFVLLSLVIGILVFNISSNIIINIQKPISVHKLGSYSTVLQQIGYTIFKHGKTAFTDEECAKLQTFMNPDTFANNYKPNIVDPILANIENWWCPSKITQENKKALLEVWLSLGKRYPLDYAMAFWLNAYRYVSPGYFDDIDIFGSLYQQSFYMDKLPDDYTPYRHSANYQQSLENFKAIAGHTSLYGFYMGVGYVVIGFALMLLIIIRNRGSALALLPAFIYSLGIMLSPVNGWIRYATPIGFAIPLALLALLKSYKGLNNAK